jgi:hypothetical protein
VTESSGRGTGRGATGQPTTQPTAERITVALIPKAGADLQKLQDRTGQGKTDIVNRAISLYAFIEAQLSAGHELAVRDGTTGETRIIVVL